MDLDNERMVYNMDRQVMDRQRMMAMDREQMDMERQMMMDRDQQRMDRNQQMMDMDRQRMDLQRERMMASMDEEQMDRYLGQEEDNQMIKTHRMMIKREAESDPAFSYTVMSEHPSQVRSFYSQLLPAMARQDVNLRQLTMKQIHPDGAFSFVRQPVNFPSTTSLYKMLNRIRPVSVAAWA